MDLLVRNNQLFVKDKIFECAIGKKGLTDNKLEGDLCTPLGSYYFNKIYYRADRLGKINFLIESSFIKENDGWCDDVNSKFYNQYIEFPFTGSAEHLYREDNIYDIICVLNYNTSPIVAGKGSAIFLHSTRPKIIGTEGCIAVEKKILLEIATNITQDSKITIEY
tara:strand:+ start:1249 stop:1743 length:495 start_codon:yes stop_codon:yes gene_type:complete